MISRDAVLMTSGFILGLVLTLGVVGVSEKGSKPKEQALAVVPSVDWGTWDHVGFTDLSRFHDNEMKVTCWAVDRKGIFCIPDYYLRR